MPFRSCRTVKRAALLAPVLLALTLLLALAQGAAAAPPAPTMDLAALRLALEAGPLDGHLVTTMKGTTPEEIPLQVQSIIDYSSGSLILFEATGPQIDKIGGVAAGMSGSPVYVDDGGVDKLVGALSYGDVFTLGGMALATPIEYMAAIEQDYPVGVPAPLLAPRPPKAGTYPLADPVRSSKGVVRSIVVARSAQAATKVPAASGQTVMAPLGILEIGGARPGSKAYDRVAARFASTGLLIKPASGNGTWTGASVPALEGGSPCAILFSQGAVWVGAAGTVTYVDGDTAMLFGHPFSQLGAIDAILTGGNVQGVWQSSMTPYKLIEPRDVKGACVQDRAWGIEAHLGQEPDLFPVTTTLTIPGSVTPVHDVSAAAEWLVSANAYPELPADIVSQVVYDALDQAAYPGSAETTTTVVVSDGTGTYTVEYPDLWSDPNDVSFSAGYDAAFILAALAADPDGVLEPRVDSVSVTADVSATQRSARIADVTLPGGISEGDNAVRISYYRYGSSVLQTVDGTLTIPKGTSLYGRLMVTPAPWMSEDGGMFPDMSAGSTVEAAPQTLAELVAELNATPQNSDLVVSYLPMGGADSPTEPEAITATVPTDYVFDSDFAAVTANVEVRVQPTKVRYGSQSVQVSGAVQSSSNVEVGIYRLDAGSATPVLVDTVAATAHDGMATFVAVIPSLTKNATIIARTGSVDGSLPGSASAKVRVSARVWLSGAARLLVHVKPGDAHGTAQLQRKKDGHWVDFRAVAVTHGTGTVKLPKGTHVLRARFSGSDLCAAGTSPAYTVTVK